MSVLSSGMILPTIEAESFPEDDIDRLFGKLQKIDPPGDIVKQILERVKRLPAPQVSPRAESENAEKKQGTTE